MTHLTRSRTSWLSKLFGRTPTAPVRRARPTRLRCEWLEDRVVPVTQIDYGGLRFVASEDFLVDPDGDYYAHEGTVQIGYTPAANESFLALVQATIVGNDTREVQLYNQSNPTQFKLYNATLELLPEGGHAVPVPVYNGNPLDGTLFTIANLIGTGGQALDTAYAKAVTVAGVDVTASLIQFANPSGGDTSDARVLLQGKATFENVPLLAGIGLEADVNGTNYLISDSTGINLTGASITKTFTLDSVTVAGTIAVGYDRPSATFTMGGGVTVTSATEASGKAALNNLGANIVASIVDGELSQFEFNVTGSFTLFETLTVSTLSNNPLFFQYKLPTQSSPTKYFQIGGGLQLQFNGQSIAADFGTEAAPGIIIAGGELQSLNATFSADLNLWGVTLKTDPAPNGLTLTYQPATPATPGNPAKPSQFVIYGGLTVGFAGQTVEASLGTAADPGFTIIDGKLTELNVGLAASINAFGLQLDIGTVGDPATVRWVPADNSFNVTGTFTANFQVFQTRLVLGGTEPPGSPPPPPGSDNAKGLSIINGHLSVPEGGQIVFDLQDAVLGPVELKDLELTYTSLSGGGVDLDVKAALSLPGGWSAAGEFDLIKEANKPVKLHTLSVDLSPAPGDMPIGDTGLSVVDIDVKVTNIDTPSQIVVTGDVAVVWGEEISLLGQDGVFLFRAQGSVLADAGEFVLDCQAQFGAYPIDGGNSWKGLLGQGDAKLTLDWADGYYALHAEVDGLGGIFNIEGDFVFESGREIAILAEAEVVIPEQVPFIGGDTIGGVGFFFQHVFDHDTTTASTTAAAWITLDIFTTFTVGFELDYKANDPTPGFSLIGGDRVAQFEQDVAPPVDRNYTFTSTFTRGAGQIDPGATSAVFGVDWSKSAVGVGLNGPPTFQVVKIVDGVAGDPIAEADFAANGISFVTDSNFNTPTSRAIQVVGSATDEYAPLGADYKVLVTFNTVGGNPFPSYPSTTAADVLLVQATSNVPLPSFGPAGATRPVAPTVPAGSPTAAFPVTVSGNIDEEFYAKARVTLYRVRQSDPFRRGVPVGKLPVTPIIPAANGVNWTATFTVPVGGLYPEAYAYYAVVDDGSNPPVQSAVSAPVTPAFAVQGTVANQNGDPAAGWTVFLDLGGDGTLDDSDPVTVTNAGGFYSFPPTFPNSPGVSPVPENTPVVVRLAVQGPQNYAPVTMPTVTYTGSAAAVADFALQERSAIKGTVFIDRNDDGVRDGDAGAAGAVVYLDLNGDDRRDATDPTAVTDTKGNYAFGGVAAGAYTVAVDVSSLGGSGPAWQQTSPTPRSRAVTVAGGGFSLREGNDFGVLPPAVVSGTVTGHGYVKGRLAPGATPQAGVTVNLLADQPVMSIDAGGGAAGNFQADTAAITGFAVYGGTPTTTAATIDTSRVLDPAPQAVYQSARDGAGRSTVVYLFGAPQGRYTVRLHFAELTAGAPGERRFDVYINQVRVLTDYDIFAAAGGANAAVVEEFTVDSSDGQIDIAFSAGSAGDATVNGIEILRPGAVVATTTTDANGDYSFTTYAPGRYVAQVVPPAGWRQVAPYHSDLQFGAGTALPAAAGGFQAVTADFDGDGFLDLATVEEPSTGRTGTFWVGYNGQDGTFGRSDTLTVPGVTTVFWFAAADLNGDGRPDLAVLETSQDGGAPLTLDAYLNTGSNAPGQRFQYVPNFWTLPAALRGRYFPDLTTADLNGDGLADLLFSVGFKVTEDPGSVVVLLNAAQPGDRTATVYPLPANSDNRYNTGGLAVADLNADGHPDVVVNSGRADLDYPDQFNTAFGDGTGRLGGWTSYSIPIGGFSGGAAAADVNGDGAADAAVIDYSEDTLGYANGASVFLGVNRGDGVLDVNLKRPFADTGSGTAPPPASKVVLRDVDGDLRPDLVVLLSSQVSRLGGADRVLVYLNSGAAPYFDPASPVTVPIPGGGTTFIAQDLLVADFTNDGLADLMALSFDGGFLVVNTSPPGQPGAAFGLAAGGTAAGNDLVIAQDAPAGAVQGAVHEDVSRNGRRDAGEPARAGAFVFADLDRNGRYDAGEPSTTTVAHGAYALSGLAPGTYSVGLVPEDGWRPAAFAEVTVGGAGPARADFGRARHLLGEVAPQAVRAGGRLDVAVPLTAAAPGDGLVFSLEGVVPAGLAIDAVRGRLEWSPTAAQVGTHTVTVRVRDPLSPLFTDTRSVTIGVSAAPATPLVAVGGGGRVRVFSTDGAPRLALAPFGAAYRGAVRVATGDVTGDGVDDVVAAKGSGGPRVVVFDGATGARVAGVRPFGPSHRGGLFVAAGDVDGDGKADVVVGRGAGYGPRVRVLSGRDMSALSDFLAFNRSFRGGVRVAAGDVTGDGRADVVVGAGPGGGSRAAVFDGATGARLASFPTSATGPVGGVFVAAGDVTGDGRADVVTSSELGGPRVVAFDGARVAAGAPGTPVADFRAGRAGGGPVRVAVKAAHGGDPAALVVGSGDRGRVAAYRLPVTAAGPPAGLFDLDVFAAPSGVFVG